MTTAVRDVFWLRIIYIVSALLCAAVMFLILGPRPEGTRGALDVSALPTVNASFNALSAVLLCTGVALVKKRRIAQHRTVMLMAFASSAAFLTSYVIYHWFKSAPTKYAGAVPGLYFAILVSHVLLAAAILPLALVTTTSRATARSPRSPFPCGSTCRSPAS
jgi:putative membrane protein